MNNRGGGGPQVSQFASEQAAGLQEVEAKLKRYRQQADKLPDLAKLIESLI